MKIKSEFTEESLVTTVHLTSQRRPVVKVLGVELKSWKSSEFLIAALDGTLVANAWH